MGVVFRQSVKSFAVVVSGAVMGALVVFLSTRYIEKEEYGFLGTITNYAITFSQLVMLGLNHTMGVYIHRFANDARKRKVLLSICIFAPLLVVGLMTVLFWLLKPALLSHFDAEDALLISSYYWWLPLFTVMFLYMVTMEQYLGSQMKVAAPAFIREIVLRVLNIALILLLGYSYISFDFFMAAYVLVYIIPVVLFFIMAARTKAFGLSFRLGDISRAEYKEILHYTWYHYLLANAIILLGYLDSLLLPVYVDKRGFSAAAVYRVAIFLISMLQMPYKAMVPASFTALARAFANDNIDEARDLFRRASVNMLIATLFVCVVLYCNLHNVVLVIPGGFSDIVPVFVILSVGYVTNIATGMNDQVLSIANYYKFNFYLSLVTVVVLFVLLKLLVPVYGVYGAAWSTTVTMMVFNLSKCVFVWRKLNMVPFSRSTLLILLSALPALAAGYYCPRLFSAVRHIYVNTFLDASARGLLILIVYFLMLLWLKPSADLETYLASVKRDKRFF